MRQTLTYTLTLQFPVNYCRYSKQRLNTVPVLTKVDYQHFFITGKNYNWCGGCSNKILILHKYVVLQKDCRSQEYAVKHMPKM